MKEFLIAFAILSVIALVNWFVGTIIFTFVFRIIRSDDSRYYLVMFWPLVLIVCALDKFIFDPFLKWITELNRKRQDEKLIKRWREKENNYE